MYSCLRMVVPGLGRHACRLDRCGGVEHALGVRGRSRARGRLAGMRTCGCRSTSTHRCTVASAFTPCNLCLAQRHASVLTVAMCPW